MERLVITSENVNDIKLIQIRGQSLKDRIDRNSRGYQRSAERATDRRSLALIQVRLKNHLPSPSCYP
jgi:hypothetical protein